MDNIELIIQASSFSTHCGPMLVTEPNVVGLLATVLVVAIVRDYHISFRLFALSNPSVPTLCLKDPQSRLTQFSRIFFWRSVARLSSNSKNRETPLLTNNKNGFYWNT